MEIKELKNRPDIHQYKKLYAYYTQFNKLLMDLRAKKLSDETVNTINNGINKVNSVSDSEKELRKLSDKEFKVYCSKVTSELVWSFKEVRKNEDY